ncbi:PEPxxWA-CTERM sorting domain-containing protein [Glacieibacterium frigidum]|uniref:PEP-CTERM sorting domain-containing protein n=1 Tax=Glacieibacterium frigidum TaxID=2593303 RepID=A0A552U950_9SPHN|nr:PEPxxWA-CTERM sorting domain-containing protein [Glacieibacterium frigidum]TRW14741.1 PEP-CTERM sorting domain-containing protein [Glacieibacterium frigidum]
MRVPATEEGNKMNFKIFGAVIAAGMICAGQASATAVVLTFDPAGSTGAQPACTGTDGGLVDRLCNHVDFIGVDYGTTAQLGVSYNAGGVATSLRAYDAGFYSGGAYNGSDGMQFSDIVFTPTAGNEVSLTSWFYTNGSATFVPYEFEVRDAANNLVLSHTDTTRGTFNANTAYYSGPLTFRFRSASGGIVLDNLAVDVRGIAVGGAVPEPTTWALMIGGFAATGIASRRRRQSLCATEA